MDRNIIAKVQGFGFDVYMRDVDHDTYLYFTDGTRVGYLQHRPYEGYTLSTVHVPNRTTGTGFQVRRQADKVNKQDLEACFTFVPSWATQDQITSVNKWRDMTTFLASDQWRAGFKLIAPVDA